MRLNGVCVALGIVLATTSVAQSVTSEVQFALAHRASVRAARLAVLSARQSAIASGAYPLTRLEAGSGTRPDVPGGEDLTLFQPIDLFGKSRAARKTANSAVTIAEVALRQASLDVQSEVLVAIANLRLARASAKNAKDLLTISEQLEHATQVRVDARALPDIQLVRAQLETTRARQVLVDREASVNAAIIKVNQAVGRDLGADAVDADFDVTLANRTQRNEVETLRAQAAQSKFTSKEASLSLLPDFEIQVRRSLWSDPVERYGVRLQLVVPLWDHGAATAKRRAAERERESFEASIADLRVRIESEIAAADLQLAAAQKSVKAYEAIVAAARELVARTERGFNAGAVTQTDIYEARRSLAESLDSLATAQQGQNLAIEACLRARGQLL